MDGLKGILSGTDGMRADMRCRHGLPRRTGRGAGRVVLADIASRGMRGQRSLAYDGHLKIARLYPRLKRFDCLTRTLIVRKFALEMGQDPLGAVDRPDGQNPVIRCFDEIRDGLVHIGK